MSGFKFEQIPQDQIRIPGENYAHTAVPYFKYENIMNEVQSQLQGRAVYELKEVVEVRFPANPYYKPVFGVDEMWRKIDNRVITWAERYKDQYQAFLAGASQEAEGTPLEELIPYGITPAQLSLCRALSIYSIEGLYHLEGPGVKRLGIHGNELKPMAKRYMENRSNGSTAQAEINTLKAQLAELLEKNGVEQQGLGEEVKLSTDLQPEEPALPDDYELMTDEQLKEAIAEKAGARPRGQPSRETLIRMARELEQV
jgi:hypothetical protein